MITNNFFFHVTRVFRKIKKKSEKEGKITRHTKSDKQLFLAEEEEKKMQNFNPEREQKNQIKKKVLFFIIFLHVQVFLRKKKNSKK